MVSLTSGTDLAPVHDICSCIDTITYIIAYTCLDPILREFALSGVNHDRSKVDTLFLPRTIRQGGCAFPGQIGRVPRSSAYTSTKPCSSSKAEMDSGEKEA